MGRARPDEGALAHMPPDQTVFLQHVECRAQGLAAAADPEGQHPLRFQAILRSIGLLPQKGAEPLGCGIFRQASPGHLFQTNFQTNSDWAYVADQPPARKAPAGR